MAKGLIGNFKSIETDEVIHDKKLSSTGAYFSEENLEVEDSIKYELTIEKPVVAHALYLDYGDTFNDQGDNETASIYDEDIVMGFLNQIELIKNKSEELLEEGIEPPNSTSILISEIILNSLTSRGIYPKRITPSAEGGLCFVFINKNQALYLEVYNKSEIGYIIEDFKKKKIVDNREISINEVAEVVENFY